MKIRLFYILLISFIALPCAGFSLDVNSIRVSLSKPQTFHSLVYLDDFSDEVKINFELEPINNERLGVFLDVNGIEIGYAVDIIDDKQQTKTEDFIFSYKSLKNSLISLNYQTLEGFKANALNLLDERQSETQFLSKTKSIKIELLGVHDFYTLYGDSLFNHFFLNKPKLSQTTAIGLSLVGGWSYKHLTLEADDSLIFSPSFLEEGIQTIDSVTAESLDFSLGPLVSVSLKNNIHLFTELKIGREYFRNLEDSDQLKRSDNQEIYSVGAGASWTSPSKNTLFMLRAWLKKSQHVETLFGNASVIVFF